MPLGRSAQGALVMAAVSHASGQWLSCYVQLWLRPLHPQMHRQVGNLRKSLFSRPIHSESVFKYKHLLTLEALTFIFYQSPRPMEWPSDSNKRGPYAYTAYTRESRAIHAR